MGSVTVLATGGTIDKVYVGSHLVIGPPAADEILALIRPGYPVTVESVLAKDSLDLTETDRAQLHRRLLDLTDDRVIITHGTDTMTLTADYLQDHRGTVPDKTVVVTGALQPAAMRVTDAQVNLASALIAVQVLPAGVYIVMNGQVFPAGTVEKDREAGRFVDLG